MSVFRQITNQLPNSSAQDPFLNIEKDRAKASNSLDDYSSMGSRRPKKRRWLQILSCLFALLIVLCGFSGYKVYKSAQDLRAQANTAVTQIKQAKDNFLSSNYSGVVGSLLELQETASSMEGITNSFWWRLASIIPYYGDDVVVARTVVDMLSDVTDNALLPLARAVEEHPPTTLVGNRAIDIDGFNALFSVFQRSIPVLKRNAEALQNMPEAHIEKLSSTINPIKEKYLSISGSIEAIDALMPVISSMVGANGDRLYLIAAQNSAETRSTGGFPGAMGTLSIHEGTLSFGDFDTCNEMVGAQIPEGITITDIEATLFGNEWMHYVPNVGYNPDFTRVATIWAAGYERNHNQHVDGVISMTPAIIQDLLGLTGGITLSDGTWLDKSNATKVLQSELYWDYFYAGASTRANNSIADALFAEVAEQCVNQLFDNMSASKALGMADILRKRVADRTVMLWLSNAEEQSHIGPLDCSGALNSNSSSPKLGTYFNACESSKLGWYADMETTIGEAYKNVDGAICYDCSTTFRNVISQQEVANGSTYIVGKAMTGDMRPWVYITAPADGYISNFETSDGRVFYQDFYQGLEVWYDQNSSLPPGSELVCTYTVTVSKDAKEPLGLSATPMLTEYR